MDFTQAAITVVADDRIVLVNGEAFKVGIGFPAELHAMRWVPANKPEHRGFIERKVGDSHAFQDFGNIQPYVKAWEIAKAEAEQAKDKARTSADEARRAAEREAIRSSEERQRQARETQIAWDKEQAALAQKTAEDIKAKAVEQAKALEADAALRRGEREKVAAFNAALVELAGSDHEVIKAMEAKLAAEGALSPDLVARRQAAREIARAEKKKLA